MIPFIAVVAPTTKCGKMTCDGKFNFPMSFTNGTVDLDLGRNVMLKNIDVKISSIVSPASTPIINVNLQFLSASMENSFTACSLILQMNNTFTFDCSNNAGRYLSLGLIVENAASSKV